MTKVISLLRGNGSFGVHFACGVYFIENKLPDFQISGTVLFIERNQKIRCALFHIEFEISHIYYSLKQVRYLIKSFIYVIRQPNCYKSLAAADLDYRF
jgi:hypothetical protein